MKTILTPASLDDLIHLLRAWRFWMLSALLGGLIGMAFYYLIPPNFRTRATAVVSFNLEKTWPNKPDNELFYYLERESRKLEEVAWNDTTLQMVADQTGQTIPELRSGKLELSQPQDGAWHFYATDKSARVATELASAWAQAFNTQAQQGIQTAVTLDAARKALVNDPSNNKLQADIASLESRSLAISPEIQISLAAALGKNLPAVRKSSPGVYAAAGAALFLSISCLLILFFPGLTPTLRGNRDHS